MIIFFQHTFTCKENDIKEDIYRLSVTDEVVRVLPPRKESQKYRGNIECKDIWHGCESDQKKEKISDKKCGTSKSDWWLKYLNFQNYYTRRVPAETIPILKVQPPEVIEWVGDSMVVIVLLCLVVWIPTPPRSVSINKMKSENCGFSSNWILHYFPLSVRVFDRHRRDISHFSHI